MTENAPFFLIIKLVINEPMNPQMNNNCRLLQFHLGGKANGTILEHTFMSISRAVRDRVVRLLCRDFQEMREQN